MSKMMQTRFAVSLAVLLAACPFAPARAEEDPEPAVPDESGILVHTVKSEYQAAPTKIRVVLPDALDKAARCTVLYVLPVEPLDETRWGDGLREIKTRNLHNRHKLICVQPSFSAIPWYADHPADPGIRQETYLLKVVVPLIDRTYPTLGRREGRLLLGFSKSGWGAFSLLLRHADIFEKAIAWDAPLMMERPDRYGMAEIFGTQENFDRYRVPALLKKQASRFAGPARLMHFGYGNFREHHQAIHGLMQGLNIEDRYRDGPQRTHGWHSGWVSEAVQMLMEDPATGSRKAERQQFQDAELITDRPFTFIFNAGQTPRIIWRDADAVRRLGFNGLLKTRWFDAQLRERPKPDAPGRWAALIEGTAPNGTPFRRSMTFFCRPPGFLFVWPPEVERKLPSQPGPIAAEIWKEHEAEVFQPLKQAMLKELNDTEAGAILMAGLYESKPLGRPARYVESAQSRHHDFQLALKLKLTGLREKVRPLAPPRKRASGPATVLREDTPAAAGMRPDTKERIDAICRAWAEDSGEPFVTLVARRGVIVTHEAFGKDKAGKPIDRDYRCEVFSITKTITGILFSQFMDQGLIGLDDSLDTVFPDYPKNDPHVPTFRMGFAHVSGLGGHGSWGGAANPWLENIVLNGIDVNEPGKVSAYSGQGFELAAAAMQIVSGKGFVRLYTEHLFEPLGFGDVPLTNASSGASLTARELGIMAQWISNRGSYRELEFISPATFEKLMPENLSKRYPALKAEEGGVGLHWHGPVRPNPKKGEQPRRLFSANTIGHGSFSGCILLIDLDRDLVVAQARKASGPRSGEWVAKLYEAVADGMEDE